MTMLRTDWLIWPETQALVEAFAVEPGALRFVGGAVRDAVLGRAVVEVDAATTLVPDAVMALLQNAGFRALPTGIAHGTVTALVGERSFEITTLRSDVQTDGRHAEVAFTEDWKEDASRRDFTMNALYLTPAGELFDYFGGVADAKAGRVRFIGDASMRIAEDYLRILRFFRFHAHYGVGDPDRGAVVACARCASGMGRLSGERVQAEMLKLLTASRAPETLVLMQHEGILAAALGMRVSTALFTPLREVTARAGALAPEAKLAAFLWPDVGELGAFAQRLRLSGKVEKLLRQLLSHATALSPETDVLAQKKLIRRLSADVFCALVVLSWADAGVGDEAFAAMIRLAQAWEVPVFPVSGQDLLERGMEAGKAVGEVLSALERAWEDADYALSRAELLELLP
ncbi:MAG: CCA tRNA nucleotidyltransferase [Rickettsiales bacterium]|nr:CCA tRNA nucleotidyltransferase [Rickettsiales bacterium]